MPVIQATSVNFYGKEKLLKFAIPRAINNYLSTRQYLSHSRIFEDRNKNILEADLIMDPQPEYHGNASVDILGGHFLPICYQMLKLLRLLQKLKIS